MTYEYALVPVSDTHAKRVPLPITQTPAERAAYLANVPAEVLDAAELWPLPTAPTTVDEPTLAADPAPATPDAITPDLTEEE